MSTDGKKQADYEGEACRGSGRLLRFLFSDLYGVLTTNLWRQEVMMVKRKVTRETEILRNARLKKGLSQQQVAVIAGVHIRQYQRLEYGERPVGSVNMRFGLTVCAILEIDPFELVCWCPEDWEGATLEDV